MSPLVMSIIRLTIRIAVVLPQPDGPTSTQISPAGTVRLSAVDGRVVGAGVDLRRLGELQLDRFAVAGRPLGLGGSG